MNLARTRLLGIILLGCLLSGCDSTPNIEVVQTDYRLVSQSGNSRLELVHSSGKRYRLSNKWLTVTGQTAGANRPGTEPLIGPAHFFHRVSSFRIHSGLVGLHLVSLRRIPAAGSDIIGQDRFLVLNTSLNKITPGRVNYSLSMQQTTAFNCLQTQNKLYVIADVDRDGYMDIGVQKELLGCQEQFDPVAGGNVLTRPVYVKTRPVWYRFNGNAWQHDRKYDGKAIPGHARSLPLIGMEKSLVQQQKSH
jgi:hypothetical protein